MLPCGHSAYRWMRERPINSSVWHEPTRSTRGLLSMRAISGYGVLLRSIQRSRTDLGRIPHPHLGTQPLQQIHEPLAVPAGFHTNQRRCLQRAIEPFRLSVPLDSFRSLNSPLSASKTATCCQLGWKSHPTIFMKASPCSPQFLVLNQKPQVHRRSLRPCSIHPGRVLCGKSGPPSDKD